MSKPEEAKKSRSDRYYYWLAIRIAVDFGATIGIPAILAALLGQRLDEWLGSEPALLIFCLVVTFAITALFIIKKAKHYAKLYE